MNGTHKMVFKNTSLDNRPFYFWWNNSIAIGNKSTPEFQLAWQIDNGNLPDVIKLVSRDLEGSVSTPGLGSLVPSNFYRVTHEYTAVLELPYNVTEIIGDGALVIDIEIVPDSQSKGNVELFTGEPTLTYIPASKNLSLIHI